MVNQSGIIVISGPSGVGKTTLYRRLLSEFPDRLDFSVSATTRSPRATETDGKDYHFLSVEEFQALIDTGEFLEWARVYHNYYGTLRSEIERINREGKTCLLDVDVQGGMSIKSACSGCPMIFIMPPDIETLEKRIVQRNLDHPEVVKLRVEQAIHELELAPRYSYRIVNDDLETAYRELRTLVESILTSTKSQR